MTLRAVENKTKIPYSTVHNIINGRIPEPDNLMKFADAFGADVRSVLRMVGYDYVANIIEKSAKDFDAQRTEEREPFHDDLPPDLQRVYAFIGRVSNELPPGKARDAYLKSLEADAESRLAAIEERLEREQQEK